MPTRARTEQQAVQVVHPHQVTRRSFAQIILIPDDNAHSTHPSKSAHIESR